jgi:hypothetical protein
MKKKKVYRPKYSEESKEYLESKRGEKHLEGFAEDEKEIIRLIARIFVDSIIRRAEANAKSKEEK